MRLAVLSPLVVVSLACTSHQGGAADDPAPTAIVAEPPPAPTAGARAEQPWRWRSYAKRSGPYAGPGPEQAWGWGSECAIEPRVKGESLEVCCADEGSRWCERLGEDFVPAAALALDAERLYVVDYCAIASGARVEAFDRRTGALQWSVALQGIGPQQHSEYANAVELRVVDDLLAVYGREAHGDYIEVLVAATGAQVHHRRLQAPDPTWRWEERGDPEEATVDLPDGAVCGFTEAKGEHVIGCGPLLGPARWMSAAIDWVDRGAVVVHEDQLVVVTWSRIANGAWAEARDLATGEVRWNVELEGIGPQDHSKYSNQIEVDYDAEGGTIDVRGLESHGRYIERRSIDTGDLIWSVAWL